MSRSMADIKAALEEFKGFVTQCPHPDLLTDLNVKADALSKEAWVLAKEDFKLLKDAQEIQAIVNEMSKSKAPGTGRRNGPPGLGDAVIVTLPADVLKSITGGSWDGSSRIGNPVYVQTLLGMDRPDSNGVFKTFIVSAINRLIRNGESVKPLILGGKRELTEALSKALTPIGETYCTAARNLRADRATFITVFDGTGKADKQHIPADLQDTYTPPRTNKEITVKRWWSPVIRTSNPIGEFLPVSTDPNLSLLKQDNAQIWIEGYHIWHELTDGGKLPYNPAPVQVQAQPAQVQQTAPTAQVAQAQPAAQNGGKNKQSAQKA